MGFISAVEIVDSRDLSPGFGSWTTPEPGHPSILVVDLQTETNGTIPGLASVNVDNSGGTSSDFTAGTSFADTALGDGGTAFESITVGLPAGASFVVRNSNDPNSSNSIGTARIARLV